VYAEAPGEPEEIFAEADDAMQEASEEIDAPGLEESSAEREGFLEGGLLRFLKQGENYKSE